MELLLFLVDEVAVFLTWFAFFNAFLAIRFYSWPEVTDSKNSGGHSTCAKMVAANALMQLLDYILGLFRSDTFEKRLAISAFVEVIAYHSISGGFSQPSFVCVLWGFASLEILNIRVWVRLWQVFVIEGVDRVCCNMDRWRPFNLVLANLDRMSALMLSILGMCSMRTCPKADWMTVRTRW